MAQALHILTRNANRLREGTASREPLSLFRAWDMVLAQIAVASAMAESARRNGSRGSALVMEDGRIRPEWIPGRGMTICSEMTSSCPEIRVEHRPEPCRPLPEPDLWFEAVWRDYRAKYQNIADCGEA